MSFVKLLYRFRMGLLLLNFLCVLFFAAIPMMAVEYAAINRLSLDLLLSLGYAPFSQSVSFWLASLLYLVLAAFLLFSFSEPDELFGSCLIIPVLCTTLIIGALNGSYNGLIFMVFSFLLTGDKPMKSPWKIIVLCVLLYLFTQYEMLSLIANIPDPQAYVHVFNRQIQNMLGVASSLLVNLNSIVFLLYVAFFLMDQYQRNDNIQKELDMVSAVNTQLQDYAAITEKIGEDKERKRLAREIHDTLGHALTGIAAGIDACIVLIDLDPNAAKKQLQIVSNVVRQGIGDVRNSLNKLRPGALEEKGFRSAIEKMIQEFMDVSSINIHFDYRLEDFDFDVTKEDMLFRIVQESITNSLRHGKATEIWISMYFDAANIYISIQDNGAGCENINLGYGLKQMQERIYIIGGKIYFDGSSGFRTVIQFPIVKGENQEGAKQP